MLPHATQTNEPARCAALLPLLARFPGPLTLIEVGASAGLCLHPDRYAYDYAGHRVGGPSPVTLTCGGVAVPIRERGGGTTTAISTAVPLPFLSPANIDLVLREIRAVIDGG